MGERGSDIEKYREGQFSDSFASEEEEKDPEKLKEATRRLKDKRLGRKPDRSIEIPDTEAGKKES